MSLEQPVAEDKMIAFINCITDSTESMVEHVGLFYESTKLSAIT